MSRRVCIVSNIYRAIDEGMAKTAYYLYKNLSKTNEVQHISNVSLNSYVGLRALLKFKPDIIHHVPGPSLRGLTLGLSLKRILRSKLAVSATRPQLNESFCKVITKFSKPDLVLVQTNDSLNLFKNSLGCKTSFLSNGVDIDRFRPVDSTVKKTLREKYNLDPSAFIALHVGPLRRGRNIATLARLSRAQNIQMILAGSTTTSSDKLVAQELLQNGCLVWNKYFPNIEELYQLSDLYVFPTFESLNCIETPLSVLEAMSTNLPVVTTNYGALPQLFKENDGLFFANDSDELINKIAQTKDIRNVNTRKKVLPYSWSNICKKLDRLYDGL